MGGTPLPEIFLESWWKMQPYLNIIDNFDAALPYTFHYVYLGSERVLKNQLSIREKGDRAEPVYEGETTKLDKNHILSGGVLKNGVQYSAKIRVQTATDVWSDWSPEISFITLTTPVVVFDNLDDKNFVYNDDILMRGIYRQEQGEQIKTFQFTLMDQNKIALTEYPVRFPNPATPSILTERISGLTKGRLYYVGLRITTQNGIKFYVDHQFVAQYIAPAINGVVEVSNTSDSGQILVQSYLRQMLGTQTKAYIPNGDESFGWNYSYMDDDWVVIPVEKPLKFERLGMAKASDWIAKIWCKYIKNGTMLVFSRQDGGEVKITFTKHDDYITCEKEYKGIKYRTKSNVIEGLGLKEFYLYIKVVEFRIQITIEEVVRADEGTEETGNA